MTQIKSEVNTQVLVTFIGPGSGLTTIPDLVVLKDGVVVVNVDVALVEIGVSNLYNIVFTPNATGMYVVYGFNEILVEVDVVTKSLERMLYSLEDVALGSWQWNKTNGEMIMLKQDGTTLAQFTVLDNLTQASRERIS